MDCRGYDNRVKICEEYVIKPLTFAVLLNGQKKYSCAAHSMLTDRYYTFEYESRLNANEKGTFFVGESSGRDFINILKSNSEVYDPPLFNPLITNLKNNSSTNENTDTDIFKMTALNKELYIIINLLCIVWDVVPYGNLQAILEFCATAKIDTQDWAIKSVNNLIGKDAYGRTLTQMIEDLKNINKDVKIKPYHFEKVQGILSRNGSKSNL